MLHYNHVTENQPIIQELSSLLHTSQQFNLACNSNTDRPYCLRISGTVTRDMYTHMCVPYEIHTEELKICKDNLLRVLLLVMCVGIVGKYANTQAFKMGTYLRFSKPLWSISDNILNLKSRDVSLFFFFGKSCSLLDL